MGEAMYYLKIRCRTEEEAEKLLPEIERFIEEAGDAEDYWRKHRDEKNKECFWEKFRERFPRIAEYLDFAGLFGLDLSGYIDFADLDKVQKPFQEGREILYCALVWYLADWDPLCAYIKNKYKVESADWISEIPRPPRPFARPGYANLFDLL